ncbi:uncharacterized protein LOC101237035 isoform X4 [Hydra vulgaris]|uniref:Uncharacterized protein LOC101237035 isoform X4 n=1 Tax=Hydra vulgaris TaxID=6087 RepID=A0ABM4BGC2_HYDVU
MHFNLQWGDAKSMILNSNCKCRILLEKIKSNCGCIVDDIIDIADMQAVVQKLCDKPDESYASEIIQPRSCYILIKVIKRCDENGQFYKEYLPLLFGLESTNPEFLLRLSSRKVNPDSFVKDNKDARFATSKIKGAGRTTTSKSNKDSNSNLTGQLIRKTRQ